MFEQAVFSMRRFCSDIKVPVHKFLLLTIDVFTISASGYFSGFIIQEWQGANLWLHIPDVSLMIFLTTMLFIVLARLNHAFSYCIILNKPRHFMAVFRVLTITFLAISALAIIFFTLISYSPSATINFLMVYFVVLLLWFTAVRVMALPSIFSSLVQSGIVNRNLIIVGHCPSALAQEKHLKRNSNSYFNVVGFVDDDISVSNDCKKGNRPVIGNLSQIKELVERHNVHDILICEEHHELESLQKVINICKSTKKTIHIVSDVYGVLNRKLEIDPVGNLRSFRIYPKESVSFHQASKRAIDFMGALIIITLLMPFLSLIALAIKLDSPGPVFYKPTMIGRDGKPFTMFKFRSMYHKCEVGVHKNKVQQMILNNADTKKIRNDSRITRVGGILRKLSFDEFPQLINVLQGNMSLVGPRPCLPYEFEVMKSWQQQRTAVKPGMTGLWQVKGRDEVLFNEQIILDLYYIEHHSILFDIEIMFETIPVVVFGRGGS